LNNKAKNWIVYIIRCNNGALYTGITIDLERRYEEHVSQGKKCSKFLRGKIPLKLVYQKRFLSHTEALQLEIKIKSLSKSQKESLILH
jgi:putative endonuclease